MTSGRFSPRLKLTSASIGLPEEPTITAVCFSIVPKIGNYYLFSKKRTSEIEIVVGKEKDPRHIFKEEELDETVHLIIFFYPCSN